jgi:hypothetical protein
MDFATPTGMTDPGAHRARLAALPSDLPGLTAVGHGLLLHEHLTWAYGVSFDEAARETVHTRPVARLLDHVLAVSDAPLTEPRPPSDRVAANCRHFTVLLVAALRVKGVPARARCGFGGYFVPGFFEDHWVCEYWTGEAWRLVDGQVDDVQRGFLPVDFDVTDVPRSRFLVAGDAWQRCRAGAASFDDFGLSVTKESGAWWVASNLMRDAAALSNVEVLPWDAWAAMPLPDSEVTELDLFDRLAGATLDPDLTGLAELMADPRLHVPGVVSNALRGREEALF